MKSVAELEMMVEEAEEQAALFVVDGKIVGAPSWNSRAKEEGEEDERRRRREREEAINKTLPAPPVPSMKTKPSTVGVDARGGGMKAEEREKVVAVKPSLLKAFEKAAEEKERRKGRRREEEREGMVENRRLGVGARRSSADVKGGGEKVDASFVPRSTTMPTLASSSTTRAPTSASTPTQQNNNITLTKVISRDSTSKPPNPPMILTLPSSSKPLLANASSETPRPPIAPSPMAAAAATAKPPPRSTTTSLTPTNSAFAEIERLKNVKASRVGAWLGGAVLAKGRGDDSEGTIKTGRRQEIVAAQDVPATGGVRKSAEVEKEWERERVVACQVEPSISVSVPAPEVASSPAQPPPPLARHSSKTPSLDMPSSSSPVLQPTNESDPEIVIPAKFASRFKKAQFAGVEKEEEIGEKPKYDGRSARGGKGGKVADVTKVSRDVFPSSLMALHVRKTELSLLLLPRSGQRSSIRKSNLLLLPQYQPQRNPNFPRLPPQ